MIEQASATLAPYGLAGLGLFVFGWTIAFLWRHHNRERDALLAAAKSERDFLQGRIDTLNAERIADIKASKEEHEEHVREVTRAAASMTSTVDLTRETLGELAAAMDRNEKGGG